MNDYEKTLLIREEIESFKQIWEGEKYTIAIKEDEDFRDIEGVEKYSLIATLNTKPYAMPSVSIHYDDFILDALKEIENEDVDAWVERKIIENREWFEEKHSFLKKYRK